MRIQGHRGIVPGTGTDASLIIEQPLRPGPGRDDFAEVASWPLARLELPAMRRQGEERPEAGLRRTFRPDAAPVFTALTVVSAVDIFEGDDCSGPATR